jgi:DoxX-like family
MNTQTQTASEWKRDEATRRNSAVVIGHVLSALTVAILLADAGVILFIPTKLQPEMSATGFPMTLARSLGVTEVLIAILYAVPRTAVLGAILIAGFFGGAICAHFRVGEMGSPAELVAAAIGVIAWAGLWLRNVRLRELLPLVSSKGAY